MAVPDHLRNAVSKLPNKPGVYQYYDKDNRILYVGKAKSLKKRVSSYFTKSHQVGRTRVMVSKINEIKTILVEFDALLLENNLIKEYQQRYNINLKDDKTYPSIVIKNERFPRVFPTRKIIKDGSEYYGPYASVKLMNAVLDLIRRLYPIRNCTYHLSEKNIEAGKFRVCLEYHLGNCLGPCEGKFSEEDYNRNVDAMRQIIKGNHVEVIKGLKELMAKYAENYEFEKAEEIKRRLDTLKKFQAKSTIVNPSIHNVDVFSIVSDNRSGYVNFLKVMNGIIVQSYTLEVRKRLDETDEELLAYAIIDIRERFKSGAREVLVSTLPELTLKDVQFVVPQRGDKKNLLDLSDRKDSYFQSDKQKKTEQIDPDAHKKLVLESLKKDLHLPELPIHIECFDNSNIQGTNPASACVVFKDAKPSKRDYRKFNIKTVDGPNDFASMEEVVYRRYKRLSEEQEPLPQLVIIDGGKGQLSSAMKALDELNLRGKMTVIGIAKRLEEIFFPGDSIPIYIDKRSPSLKLIQHLRNEAHRFSLSHHRDRRSSSALRSSLTEIKGVGFRTAQTLLYEFKTIEAIREASLEELEKVVNKKVARAVYDAYR
ncbi:MAG: excinuclease ABC subunit UvrC [Flavobacteriales bacterium]|nr:excinuclease ABC subunit UvrC [Flavobacteriales bacterium]